MSNWLNNIWSSICSWTVSGIGVTVATTGIVIKEIAIVVIMIGILLWMYKCTKVFRWGAAGYMVGLILELIGSMMM